MYVGQDEGAVEADGEEAELVQMLLRFRFLLACKCVRVSYVEPATSLDEN